MDSRGSSVWRPSTRCHGLRSLPAISTTSLIALLITMLALFDTNHVSASFQPSSSDINIGAFNIKQFGLKKTENRVVMTEIARIVTQFDIIAIQEILSNTEVANVLLDYVTQCKCSGEQSCQYDHEISEPLGRSFVGSGNTIKDYARQALVSGQRERYGFFYRRDTVQIVKTYQYKGGPFARPPFAAHVKLRNFNTIPEFLFIVVHVQPSNAAEEINSLQRVYDDFRQRSGISYVIIGGDLNAGCGYWREQQNTALTQNDGFYWLINSNAKTNVASSRSCPYDRFITKGRALMQYIRYGRADVYNYTVSGNIEQSAISDHYPIGMRLAVGNRMSRSPPECPTVYHASRSPKRPARSPKDRLRTKLRNQYWH